MYGGRLHNTGFIERVLAELSEVDRETYPTFDRIQGMLHTALEEITFGVQPKTPEDAKELQQLEPQIPKTDPAEIDHHPFFFTPSAISKVLHCQAPPLAAMRGALRHAGYRATMSHCKPGSIRTDASWTAIWHIMLEWIRQKAPLKKNLKKGTPGYNIIRKGTAYAAAYKEDEEVGDTSGTGTTESAKPAGEDTASNDTSKVQDQKPDIKARSASETRANTAPRYLSAAFEVKFDEELGRDHDRGKYVRYQLAPRENWGPMARAK